MSEKIQILLNGQETEVQASLSLEEHLHSFVQDATSRQGKGLAICVNFEVISRDSWSETTLSEKDSVEIVIAAPGG